MKTMFFSCTKNPNGLFLGLINIYERMSLGEWDSYLVIFQSISRLFIIHKKDNFIYTSKVKHHPYFVETIFNQW